MPDDVTVDIIGLDEAIKKLEKLGKMNTLHAAIQSAGMYIKGLMTVYPPRTHIPLSAVGGFKTDKSRRYFFWALKKGLIEVPYRRGQSPGSESLDKKWTSKYDRNKFEAVVGNNASYARLVQGGKQTKMMKMIGWKTVDKVAKAETKKVGEMVFRAVKRAIDQA